MSGVKCEHGHPVCVGTDVWIDSLTVDQIRYAQERINSVLEAIDQEPKKTVWRVSDGITCVGNYREEAYEEAVNHLMRIFKDNFMSEARHFLDSPSGSLTFTRALPKVFPEIVTQHEYSKEWFPE